jgi:hypothetical protein
VSQRGGSAIDELATGGQEFATSSPSNFRQSSAAHRSQRIDPTETGWRLPRMSRRASIQEGWFHEDVAMIATSLDVFDATLHETYEWLRDLEVHSHHCCHRRKSESDWHELDVAARDPIRDVRSGS